MLKEYSVNDALVWDEIVRSFCRRDVYWLSGYTKAFELHGDGEPVLLLYENEGIKGINVVMKRDIADDKHFKGILEKGKYYDLSTVYGYGGWIFEGEKMIGTYTEQFIREMDEWYSDNNIVSEFIRFHPVIDNESMVDEQIYEKIRLGNTVAIMLDDEESVWNRYSSKNRGHIRKAEKEGVSIITSDSVEAYEIFNSIYETTMNQDEAVDYYYFDSEFFDSIRNDLKEHAMVYIAYLKERPIAAAIMLYENKYISYHLSGQIMEFRKYAGTNMILNEAAKWGCANGFEWLHLGGGLGAKEGPLYDFKKSFYKKGEDKAFYIGKKIINRKIYDELVSMRNLTSDTAFFPKYRAE